MLRTETTGRRTACFEERCLQLPDAAGFSVEVFHRAAMRPIATAAELSLSGIDHRVAGRAELLDWIRCRIDSLPRDLEHASGVA